MNFGYASCNLEIGICTFWVVSIPYFQTFGDSVSLESLSSFAPEFLRNSRTQAVLQFLLAQFFLVSLPLHACI